MTARTRRLVAPLAYEQLGIVMFPKWTSVCEETRALAITEEARHRLYRRLEETLGPEEATILMEHLPPVGWADVTTKRDLDQLAVATKRDLDQLAVATKRDLDQLAVATRRDLDHLAERFELKLESGLNGLRAEFHRDLRTQLITTIASQTAIATMLVAAVKLI